METNKDIFDMIHDGDDFELQEETAILSKTEGCYLTNIPFLNEVDVCVLCGKPKGEHTYRHKFIRAHDDYRCIYCLKHFFEHPHSFDLALMKMGDPEHHHFESFTKIR